MTQVANSRIVRALMCGGGDSGAGVAGCGYSSLRSTNSSRPLFTYLTEKGCVVTATFGEVTHTREQHQRHLRGTYPGSRLHGRLTFNLAASEL